MLLLGLIIIAAGAVLIVLGVFTADSKAGDLTIAGVDVSPEVLFLLGVGAGVAILFGISVTKFGARRELKQRKEQKKLDELSEKLDRAEAGRRRDIDDDPDLRS